MYFDLNNRDKKIARVAIDKGLDEEYRQGLEKLAHVLKEWRAENLNNRDAYLKLSKIAEEHDKQLSKRYDGLGGSKYLFTVAAIFHNGYIAEEDIIDLSGEAREQIDRWLKVWKSTEKSSSSTRS